MIEDIPDYLPIWMLLAVSLGFLIGWACGDEYRRRIHAEERVSELSEELDELKEQIKLLSNTPSAAVSKGLQNTPPKLPEINAKYRYFGCAKTYALKNNS